MKNGLFVLKIDNDSTLTYKDEQFRIIEGADAGLFINFKQLELLKQEKMVASGLRIEQ